MKATGIVRRIDDLGRIVIPKEIRKTFKIHEGSPLEIFTDSDGSIIFKKYSPVGEMGNLAQIYADTLNSVLSCACVISDTDKIIAVSGVSKKDFAEKAVSDKIRNFITQRKTQCTEESMLITDSSERKSDYCCLILSSGDVMGTIILTGTSKKDINTQSVVKATALLLGKQAE